MSNRPDWLLDEIRRGFTRLLALGTMEGQPALDVIPTATVNAWCDAILRRRSLTERDRARVREGFELLVGQVHRWPLPSDLLAAIPRSVTATAAVTPRLMSDEGQRRGLQALADIAAKIRVPGSDEVH